MVLLYYGEGCPRRAARYTDIRRCIGDGDICASEDLDLSFWAAKRGNPARDRLMQQCSAGPSDLFLACHERQCR
jgi:hypothetical protein